MSESIRKRILLVEDEALIAMTETMQLEKYGYAVHHVTTGEKAVQTITDNSHPVDLILMDINLGSGIDGTQAAEEILDHKDIPVVFLSSHTETEVVEKTEKITSYGYVVKSSSIVVLDASIKMALKLFEANKRLTNELTERKRAEEKIQEVDLRMRKLFKNVPELIYQFTRRPDGSYYVPMASDGIRNIFGCTPEDVRDNFEPISRVIYPEDAARVIEDIEYSAKHLTYFICEFRVHIPGRGIQWILSRSTPEKLPDGSVTWYGCNADITERKHAEDSLQATVYELKKSQEVAKVGSWVWHISQNRVEWSDEMYRIFGIDKELFTGELAQLINDCIHPDDRAEVNRSNASVMEKNTPIPVEYRIVRPDGSGRTVWAEAGELELDEAGKPMLLRGIVHDITERKITENQIKEYANRLELTMEAANMAWWVMYVDSRKVNFSSKKAEMLGYSPDQFHHYEDFTKIVHPDDYKPMMTSMRALLDGTEDKYDIEYRIKAQSGEYRWFHDIGTITQRDGEGKPLKVSGIVIHFTGRKMAEEEIQKQLSEKEILLREVHHRVKNNITSIEGFLSLQAGSTVNAEVKAALQEAISRVQSIRVLYDKLLLSKDLDEISIKNYAEDLITSLVMFFGLESSITIEKHIADFEVDARKAVSIGIIINELLSNVFKYAFGDRNAGLISVSIEKNKKMVTLIIQDNGIGIDERILENKSPGFGLTIVNMLVEQLNGTYGVANDNGTKSVIQFKI